MKNWLIAIVVIVLVAAAAWYFLARPPEAEPVASPPPARQEEAPQKARPVEQAPVQPASEPVTEEPMAEEAPLPDLAESDPFAVDELSDLVGENDVQEYWAQEGVISRVVATVDALDGRQLPGVVLAVRGPASDFEASPVDNPETVIRNAQGDAVPQFVLDPSNYERYEPYVNMLESADTDQIVDLYRRNEPLFQQAYRQLGYTDGRFQDRLIEIIDELLATPTVEGPVRLVKPEAYYLFADPELEALNAGQKIMVRMGSENAARVKAKLARIRDALSGT
jgi:hypothetical protein